MLNPIWQKVPETARRVRMRIERVLDAAKVKGLRSGDNPARMRGHLDHILPKHAKSTKGHHAALDFKDVPDFMLRLSQDGEPQCPRARIHGAHGHAHG